jgi:hypothetical protein
MALVRALVAALLVAACGGASSSAVDAGDRAAPDSADNDPVDAEARADAAAASRDSVSFDRGSATPPAPIVLDSRLVGTWNVTYAYFTADGAQTQPYAALRGKPMTLAADGRFMFNGGAGTWTIAPVTEDDWTRWGVGPYTQTRRIVERPDTGGMVDGPITENDVSIFGFKVHYRVSSGPPGRMDIEFGRSKK